MVSSGTCRLRRVRGRLGGRGSRRDRQTGIHHGRDPAGTGVLRFRPVPLDGVRGLDLSEAAPIAFVVVLGARADEAERDRLRELGSQSAGLPLLLIAPLPPARDLVAELAAVTDVRTIAGADALQTTGLAAMDASCGSS